MYCKSISISVISKELNYWRFGYLETYWLVREPWEPYCDTHAQLVLSTKMLRKADMSLHGKPLQPSMEFTVVGWELGSTFPEFWWLELGTFPMGGWNWAPFTWVDGTGFHFLMCEWNWVPPFPGVDGTGSHILLEWIELGPTFPSILLGCMELGPIYISILLGYIDELGSTFPRIKWNWVPHFSAFCWGGWNSAPFSPVFCWIK